MPIYEYKCEHCNETFEVLQKFSDDPLTGCILCSEGPVKKLISASSFILKGAGFYVNDYASDSRKKAAESESFLAHMERVEEALDWHLSRKK